jgi:uncharacterized protein (TIGR02466 family)
MNPERHFLFSTPVLVSHPSYSFSKAELNSIQKLKQSPNIHNSYSVDKYIFDNNKKKFKSIRDYCQRHVDYYAYEILKITPETKFYITQSWANYNKKGDTHQQHGHPNSLISGILFVQGRGATRFYRRNEGFPLEFQHTEYNYCNAESFHFDLVIGQLCLFPSNIEHSVVENKLDTTRITLSFNTFAKGKFGEADSCVCFLKL